MLRLQEYTLKPSEYLGSLDFYHTLRNFGVVDNCNEDVAEQFARLIYKNIKAPRIIMVESMKNMYSLFANNSLIARIKNGHITQLWLPGMVKNDSNNTFLGGYGIEYVTSACFPDLVSAGDDFMQYGFDLKHLYVPKLETAGDNLLRFSQLTKFNAPALTKVGDYCLFRAEDLNVFNTPNLTKVGKNCLYNNNGLKKISLPEVKKLSNGFMYANEKLAEVDAPKLTCVGVDCQPLFYDTVLTNKSKSR